MPSPEAYQPRASFDASALVLRARQGLTLDGKVYPTGAIVDLRKNDPGVRLRRILHEQRRLDMLTRAELEAYLQKK